MQQQQHNQQQQQQTAGTWLPQGAWTSPDAHSVPPWAPPSYPGGPPSHSPAEQLPLAAWDTSPGHLQALLDFRAEPSHHATAASMALTFEPDVQDELPGCWTSEDPLRLTTTSTADLMHALPALPASTDEDLVHFFPAPAPFANHEPTALTTAAPGPSTGYPEYFDPAYLFTAPASQAPLLRMPPPSASSSQPSDAQAQLDKARRRAEKLLAEIKRTGSRDRRGKPDELVQQMRGLLGQLEAAVAENQKIVSRKHLTSMQIELAERERAWIQLDTEHDAGAPLVMQAQLLAQARPAASGALVSVLQLPPVDGWSELWTSRVRSMRTFDVLCLHRQFLQHCALLLPKTDLPQAFPSAAAELEDFYARYRTFSQQLIRLAPGPWHESSTYDLDTLQPLSTPMAQHPLERFLTTQFLSPDELESMMAVIRHFNGNMAKLLQQQHELQRRLNRLGGGSTGRSSGTGSGTAGAEFPVEPEDDVEATLVLKQLSTNLREQKFLHRTFFYSVNCAISAASLTRMRLLMYPFATNGQLFLNDPHSTDGPNSTGSPNSCSEIVHV